MSPLKKPGGLFLGGKHYLLNLGTREIPKPTTAKAIPRPTKAESPSLAKTPVTTEPKAPTKPVTAVVIDVIKASIQNTPFKNFYIKLFFRTSKK